PPISTLFPYTTLFRSQQVNASAGAAREVRELVGEKALAGSGQAREEHHAPAGKLADLAGEPRVGVQHQARGVAGAQATKPSQTRSEEHTSELQSRFDL